MKTFRKVLIYVVFIYVLLVAIAILFQEKLLFRNTKLPMDYSYHFEEDFEEIWFDPEVNVKINALYFKTDSASRKGLIIYFHGNADDLRRWGKHALDFTKNDYDILMVDYRQFGKSTGELSEKALHTDANYVYDWAKKHFPENQIILYGRSLGTGIATRLASENRPKMLLLETPYFNLADVVNSYFPLILYNSMLKYQFRTDLCIQQVHCRIHFFHGTKDAVVPYNSSLKLAALLNKKPSEILTTIPDGRHKNLGDFQEYHQALDSLLQH
jgi:pimeloyl-ACP methyl ester carboxylesterase